MSKKIIETMATVFSGLRSPAGSTQVAGRSSATEMDGRDSGKCVLSAVGGVQTYKL